MLKQISIVKIIQRDTICSFVNIHPYIKMISAKLTIIKPNCYIKLIRKGLNLQKNTNITYILDFIINLFFKRTYNKAKGIVAMRKREPKFNGTNITITIIASCNAPYKTETHKCGHF